MRSEAALGSVCGNELLRRTQSLVQELWVRVWAASGQAPGDKQRLFQEHVLVFEHFCAGDLPSALAAFRDHLDLPLRAGPLMHSSNGHRKGGDVPS